MTKGKHLKGEIHLLLSSLNVAASRHQTDEMQSLEQHYNVSCLYCDIAQKKVLVIYEFAESSLNFFCIIWK